MKQTSSLPEPNPDRRASVRRTAMIVAACALASYVAFFISVLASQ